MVHVLNLAYQEEISLGRGHDVDVRVTDISVSRLHGYLKKSESGFFYIQDNDSKFGTLALVRQPALINSSCNNVYQVGKTLIVFDSEKVKEKVSIPAQVREMMRYAFRCFKVPEGVADVDEIGCAGCLCF